MPKWLLLIFFVGALAPLAAQPSGGRALVISDIHFDPVADKSVVKDLITRPANEWVGILRASADAPFARRGSDSNYSLMSAVLQRAAQEGPFDYVIFLGDALRHHFSEALVAAGGANADVPSFATKTAVYIASVLQTKFHAPVLFTVGNNDSTCGDYQMDPDDALFRDLSKELPALSRSPNAKSSFQFGGYYSIPNPGSPAQEIIVLNSVLWSPKFSPCGPVRANPGGLELDWLNSELDEVQGHRRTAILAMHIPPGADVNASLGKCAETPFWKSQYLTRFQEIVEKHRATIRFAIAGHTHRDDFRILANRKGSPLLFIRISSSVSPIYDNDPEFSVLTYSSPLGDVSDLVTYSLDLSAQPPAWRAGYSFFHAYGMQALNAKNGASLAASIRTGNQRVRQEYETHYAIGVPQPFQSADFDYYGCALTTLSDPEFKSCVCH